MATSYVDYIPIPLGDFVTNEDSVTYCVTKVKEYDTELPQVSLPKSHSPFTVDGITQWFECILEGQTGLMVINGCIIGDGFDDSYPVTCDYCYDSIEGTYRRCTHHQLDMCDRCYTSHSIPEERLRKIKETDSEDRKKWLEKINRKDVLDRERRQLLLEECLNCELKEMDEKLTCKVCNAPSLVVPGEWKRFDDMTVCSACVKWLEECQLHTGTCCGVCDRQCKDGDDKFIIARHETRPRGYVGVCDECIDLIGGGESIDITTTYGSLMEWVPIATHDSHTLLYNVAKESEMYHRVALEVCDDHGRTGMYFTELSLEAAISELSGLDEKYQEKYKGEKRSWRAHYDSPICRMARNRKRQVQFG